MTLLAGWLWSTIRRDLSAPARAPARVAMVVGVGGNVLDLGYETAREPLALPRHELGLSPPVRTASLLVAAVGLAWSSWARAVLGPAWSRGTTPVGGLCTTGPYRRTRHPIYAGALVFYLGLIGAQGDAAGAVVFGSHVAGYAAKTAVEDRLLMRDAEYRRYARAVPWRLVPHLW
jgi:protein-S-isoprenylcysteine O-methyltransferase Ste14